MRYTQAALHVLIIAVVIAGVVPVWASVVDPPFPEDPEVASRHLAAHGVSADQLYLAVGGAEVNAFNFNLVVSFSEGVGFSMPVDGGLNVSLSRVYNSQYEQKKEWRCMRDCDPVNDDSPQSKTYTSIPRQNPLGLGWEFHLGRIYKRDKTFCEPPVNTCGQVDPYDPDATWDLLNAVEGYWAYVAPDGAEHTLFFDSADGNVNVYYTKDGSMIKGLEITEGSPSQTHWELYLPDGKIIELKHEVTGTRFLEVEHTPDCELGTWPGFTQNPNGDVLLPSGPPATYDWDKVGFYTSRIRTREEIAGEPAAYVDVEYHIAPFDYIISRVSDSHDAEAQAAGRVRDILVTIQTNPSDPDYGHISDVRFPSPPDENGEAKPRVAFAFEYETKMLEVGVYDQEVRVLSRVNMPGGYSIEYGYADNSALLTRIRYPSGKVVRFEYASYSRLWREIKDVDGQSNGSCDCVEKPDLKATFTGLYQKAEYLDGNDEGTPDRVWTFGVTNEESGDPEATGEQLCPPGEGGGGITECGEEYQVHYYDSVSSMIDPAGNITKIVFDTSTHGPYDAESYWIGPQDTAYFGKAKEERYYAGQDPTEEAKLKQVTREWQGRTTDPCHQTTWATLKREEVCYFDDLEQPCVETLNEDWDDWGHYETTTISGSGASPGRKSHTDYAINNESASGTPCPSAQALKDNWLPNVVANKTVHHTDGTQPTIEQATHFAFDTTTGRVTDVVARAVPDEGEACDQTLEAIAPAADDIVTSYTYDPQGNVDTAIRKFGDGSDPHTINYEYSYGVRSEQRNTALSYSNVISTVDPATSLVVAEEYGAEYAGDPLAVTRTTVYDDLRRPLREQIGDDYPTCYYYENGDLPQDPGSRLESVRTAQAADQSCGDPTPPSPETESIEYYDYAGRVDKVRKLNPDGTYAYQHTCFDLAGRVEFSSEWTLADTIDCSSPGVAGTATDYTFTYASVECEDPFGRPHTVTGTLGEVTNFAYFGTNKTVTVLGVALAGSGEDFDSSTADSATTYYTDGLGRLRAVDSPSTSGGSAAESPAADAIYTYDYADRLLQVDLVDELSLDPTPEDRYNDDSPPGQLRTFTFDALGRQTSATHPENGTVSTLEFNPLGAPLTVQDALGAARGYHHETSYDSAGRPWRVERVLDDPADGFSWVWGPDDPAWTSDGFDTTNSVQCLGASAWYIGNGGCSYGSNNQVATLTLSEFTVPAGIGAQLHFYYFREVRDTIGAGGSKDVFEVKATTNTSSPDWNTADVLYWTDSNQLSWSRWKRSPAIPLDQYEGQPILLRFEFHSETAKNFAVTRGIGINEIVVERPAAEILAETAYDQDFGVSGNKSRGQPTTVVSYDDATHGPVYTKQLIYADPLGRLSEERVELDWQRDYATTEFVSGYSYDDFGRLESQVLPHLAGEPTTRSVDFGYRQGALVGVGTGYDGFESILKDSVEDPGIEYNLAGGIHVVRYSNDTETTIGHNAAYLPSQIQVKEGANVLFDSGSYAYDGARNISAIGNDQYRYDLVGRLRRANVTSDNFASGLYLDYQFDPYGNMTARQTGLTKTAYSGDGPFGLHFPARTVSAESNRITDAGFDYDANGNLIAEPAHEGVGGYRYAFSPENRLRLVQPIDGGQIYQEGLYDPSGNRFVKVSSGTGGEGLISLRDATGQVVSEYVDTSNSPDGPYLSKQYIRGAGHLLATKNTCGPAPALRVVEASAGTVTLEKVDYVDPVSEYELKFEYESGGNETESVSIPTDQFTVTVNGHDDENVWISLKTHAACGDTGESNRVSFWKQPTMSFDCIESVGLSNLNFDFGSSTTRATLRVTGKKSATQCTSGYQFRLYRRPEGGGAPVLVADELLEPEVDLEDTPISAGYGSYGFVEYNPNTGIEDMFVPQAINDDRNAAPGPVGTTTEFVHWDHLGSTRLITDSNGAEVAGFKYYPFGHYAEASGGSDLRMKFTGHERDEELGLDYMLARSFSPSVARFLSVDPVEDVQLGTPQSWDKYAYVRNNPLRNIDPTGAEYVDAEGTKQHEGTQTDPSMTKTEKEVTQNVDASPLPVQTDVVPEAAAKIAPKGAAVSPGDALEPGELIVVGDQTSVDNLTTARAGQGSPSSIQDEWVANRSGAPGAGIVIFQGSLEIAPPAGATSLEHAVRTAFVHGSAHLEGRAPGTGTNSEAEVFIRLFGTASQ